MKISALCRYSLTLLLAAVAACAAPRRAVDDAAAHVAGGSHALASVELGHVDAAAAACLRTGPVAVSGASLSAVADLDGTSHLLGFGGISGVDVGDDGEVVMLSDDRGRDGVPRWYPARLVASQQGSMRLDIAAGQPLLPAQSTLAVDPESMRFDPAGPDLWWTSEGDIARGVPPGLYRRAPDGSETAQPLPAWLTTLSATTGPRNNRALESLSFDGDGRGYWLAVESALVQDGAMPTQSAGALARLAHFDREGRLRRVLAYPLDAVPFHTPADQGREDNGISEILHWDDGHLLVLERAGHDVGQFHFEFDVRLYLVALHGAPNVSDLAVLDQSTTPRLAKKPLLRIPAGCPGLSANYEAMAWLPAAPGSDTRRLLLVADNGLEPRTPTRMIVIDIPRGAGR